MVGGCEMITNARIADFAALSGVNWITALRAPTIAALASEDGPLRMSLFDIQNFTEITHEDFPGERLICCHNPMLAGERARKISTEVAFDGIYVIRTSVSTPTLGTTEVVRAYQNLAYIERDFRSIKTDDLDPRPVDHCLPHRVTACVFLCTLAAYLTWHLRKTLAPLTFTNEDVPEKARDDLPVCDYPGLIAHLGNLTRNTISFAGQHFEKLTNPTLYSAGPSSYSIHPSHSP
jgi:transposase